MVVSSSSLRNPVQAPPRGTLLLTRGEVAALLSLRDCIAAVKTALQLHASGQSLPPAVLGIHAKDGGFHIKAAGLTLERPYFAAKTNANFPHNGARFGLPTIQGVVLLADAANGSVLAILDSIEITRLRTAAATAIAAEYLARRDARTATICGGGVQGRIQLAALAEVLPLDRAYVWDLEPLRAQAFADEEASRLGMEIIAAKALAPALADSAIVVTCTSARTPFLALDAVWPGTFVAAVGADAPEKQELEPALLASGMLVVDHLEQCATIGELHHALEAGLMRRQDVHGELAELVAGTKPGRTRDDAITIFDSTGIALEDVAAAVAVYRAALERNAGRFVAFGD